MADKKADTTKDAKKDETKKEEDKKEEEKKEPNDKFYGKSVFLMHFY